MSKITNQYYEELAYIESTGTQYINTGVNISSTTNLKIEFAYTNISGQQALLGATTDNHQSVFSIESSKFRATWGEGTTYRDFANADTNWHTFEVNNGTLYFDGVEIGTQGNGFSGTPITLFRQNYPSSALWWYSKAKVKSFQIGTSRNFIPARRKSDNVVGLLDITNNDFYTNSGSGTFSYGLLVDVTVDPVNSGTITGTGDYIVGSNVTLTAIPNSGYSFEKWINKEYILLSAIESTGTQYIDTGVANKSGLQFLTKCTFKDSTGRGTVLAQSTSSNYAPCISREFIRPSVGYKTYNPNPYLNLDELYTIVVNDNMCVINGTQYQYTSNTDLLPGGNIWIFRRADGNYYGKVKLQMLQIYDGTSIIRDFVPVMRQGDLAVGLLDLVEMKFYGNSGTGDFLAYEESTTTQYPTINTINPLTITNISNSIILTAQFKKSANCRYKVNGAWKNAMMYIKQNGTWKPGTPKIKINGNWKEGG